MPSILSEAAMPAAFMDDRKRPLSVGSTSSSTSSSLPRRYRKKKLASVADSAAVFDAVDPASVAGAHSTSLSTVDEGGSPAPNSERVPPFFRFLSIDSDRPSPSSDPPALAGCLRREYCHDSSGTDEDSSLPLIDGSVDSTATRTSTPVDGRRSNAGSASTAAMADRCNGAAGYVARVIQEIVETERTYVRDLGEIVHGYMDYMVRSSLQNLSPIDLKSLFGNIVEIYSFNRNFLSLLEQCGCDPVNIAYCFVSQTEGFTIYSDYCSNYPRAVDVLTTCMRDSVMAATLKRQQTALQHCLPLGSYLLKPVQRILKYHLLLQNILKSHGESADGYSVIQAAVGCMRSVAAHINEMKARHEQAVRTQEIQSVLYGWDGADLTTFGELVIEDKFRMCGARADRLVFLFKKAVLIAKKKDEATLFVKAFIECSNLMLIESVPKEPLCFHIVPFDSPRLQFTLQARNLDQKRLWCQQIKRVILDNYSAVIPDKAKELVMKLGSRREEDTENIENVRRQHIAPQYLEKRRMRRKSAGIISELKVKNNKRGGGRIEPLHPSATNSVLYPQPRRKSDVSDLLLGTFKLRVDKATSSDDINIHQSKQQRKLDERSKSLTRDRKFTLSREVISPTVEKKNVIPIPTKPTESKLETFSPAVNDTVDGHQANHGEKLSGRNLPRIDSIALMKSKRLSMVSNVSQNVADLDLDGSGAQCDTELHVYEFIDGEDLKLNEDQKDGASRSRKESCEPEYVYTHFGEEIISRGHNDGDVVEKENVRAPGTSSDTSLGRQMKAMTSSSNSSQHGEQNTNAAKDIGGTDSVAVRDAARVTELQGARASENEHQDVDGEESVALDDENPWLPQQQRGRVSRSYLRLRTDPPTYVAAGVRRLPQSADPVTPTAPPRRCSCDCFVNTLVSPPGGRVAHPACRHKRVQMKEADPRSNAGSTTSNKTSESSSVDKVAEDVADVLKTVGGLIDENVCKPLQLNSSDLEREIMEELRRQAAEAPGLSFTGGGVGSTSTPSPISKSFVFPSPRCETASVSSADDESSSVSGGSSSSTASLHRRLLGLDPYCTNPSWIQHDPASPMAPDGAFSLPVGAVESPTERLVDSLKNMFAFFIARLGGGHEENGADGDEDDPAEGPTRGGGTAQTARDRFRRFINHHRHQSRIRGDYAAALLASLTAELSADAGGERAVIGERMAVAKPPLDRVLTLVPPANHGRGRHGCRRRNTAGDVDVVGNKARLAVESVRIHSVDRPRSADESVEREWNWPQPPTTHRAGSSVEDESDSVTSSSRSSFYENKLLNDLEVDGAGDDELTADADDGSGVDPRDSDFWEPVIEDLHESPACENCSNSSQSSMPVQLQQPAGASTTNGHRKLERTMPNPGDSNRTEDNADEVINRTVKDDVVLRVFESPSTLVLTSSAGGADADDNQCSAVKNATRADVNSLHLSTSEEE